MIRGEIRAKQMAFGQGMVVTGGYRSCVMRLGSISFPNHQLLSNPSDICVVRLPTHSQSPIHEAQALDFILFELDLLLKSVSA